MAAAAPGPIDGHFDPIPDADLPTTATKSATFPMVAVGSPLSTDCTNAQFLPYPSTSALINYSLVGAGTWVWMWYGFQITLPTVAYDPTFWYCGFTVQKVNASGTPSPDWEGVDEDPRYHGRQFTDTGQFTGGVTGQGDSLLITSDANTWWSYPPVNNLDGTPDTYRTYRFRAYAFSRLNSPITGKPGTPTLQQCLPGGADHSRSHNLSTTGFFGFVSSKSKFTFFFIYCSR